MLSKGYDNRVLITATINAMREELDNEKYRKNISTLTLPKALTRMKQDIVILSEELSEQKLDYGDIRKALAKVVISAGAAIVDCNRMIFKKGISK